VTDSGGMGDVTYSRLRANLDGRIAPAEFQKVERASMPVRHSQPPRP
jgi:hypothetical protein